MALTQPRFATKLCMNLSQGEAKWEQPVGVTWIGFIKGLCPFLPLSLFNYCVSAYGLGLLNQIENNRSVLRNY